MRLSSVELRLFPWPGFVLTDLTVAEDPAYGAEPVLHANTVRANIRLLSLWRGKLEISGIHVDEASLNLVRAGAGRWNLDPLFRTAAAHGKAAAEAGRAFPYLEATNSRINIKNGAEKLPFSLTDTDLSFWQPNPDEWRIRLRGQPARTDVALDSGDTGIVRLEASMRRAPALRLMPVRLDLDWREAQLGQLARLLIGSDPGWRGDLTGEVHVDGTPDAAQFTTRLRATGVHRAEFAPLAPMDFDANCGFVYHYSRRALDGLVCDSPLGDGHFKLTGELPGENAEPSLTLELDRIPAAAGLDALRTVRSDLAANLEAAGSVSGKLVFAPQAVQDAPSPRNTKNPGKSRAEAPAPAHGPLTGRLVVEGLAISGGALGQPLRAARIVLEPANGNGQERAALEGTAAFPAGGAAPLTVNVRLGLYSYRAVLRGPVSIARARELAQTAGISRVEVLNGLAGDPLAVNLTAEGPWLESQPAVPAGEAAVQFALAETASRLSADSIVGTVTIHDANWKADYLANRVRIAQATLHLGNGELRWDPVAFTYGPVKGTATLTVPESCPVQEAAGPPPDPDACAPRFEVEFGALDAAAMQAAFLGARQKGTLLSDLIDRFHPASTPPWPAMQGTLTADSLVLGPVALNNASATVKISAAGAELSDLTAGLLGGQVQGSGTIAWAGPGQQQPAYSLELECDHLNPTAVGQLLAMRWSGGSLAASGKIDLSGFTPEDLAGSAKGTLHFDWRHGSMGRPEGRRRGAAPTNSLPPALARFDDWSGDAEIAKGGITLGENQIVGAGRKRAVDGSLTFAEPPKIVLTIAAAPSKKP